MNMRASYTVGIDLGGTNIKAVAVSDQGEVLGRESRLTQQAPASVDCWVRTIREMVKGFKTEQAEAATHVGLATPGVIAMDSRSVASCPGKLAGIEGFDWTPALGRQEVVRLVND